MLDSIIFSVPAQDYLKVHCLVTFHHINVNGYQFKEERKGETGVLFLVFFFQVGTVNPTNMVLT